MLRTFTGDEFTVDVGARLADADIEHVAALVEHLARFYWDWLETEEAARADPAAPDVFHCIEPYGPERSASENIDRYKALLLYFPHVAIPDPLGNALWPLITAGALFNEITLTDESEPIFRARMRSAVTELAALAPLIDAGDVVMLPSTFALDYAKIQEAARAFTRSYAAAPLPDLPADHPTVGATAAWANVCAACDFTPLATSDDVERLMRRDIAEFEHLAANAQVRTSNVLSRQRLTGIDRIPFTDVIRLRRDDEAFATWRRALEAVMERVHGERVEDERAFEREFRHAAEELLTPEIERMERALRGSVFGDLVVPGGVAVAGGVITLALTHGFPAATLAAGPLSYVGKLLYNRYGKAGRRAGLVRQFFGRLISSGCT